MQITPSRFFTLIIISFSLKSLSLLHAASSSGKIYTTAKIAKGLGHAALNPKAVFDSCSKLKQSIVGQTGILPTLKHLQQDSLKTIIEGSDNVILSTFVTAHILERTITLTIQQITLNSIFKDLANVGQSVATTIEQLLQLSAVSGNMLNIIIFDDAPEIMKNLQTLLEQFSNRLVKIGSFFKPQELNFLDTLRRQLHTEIDTSITQSNAFYKSIKNELGDLSLEELHVISKNKDFSSLKNLGGKVALFFESFGTMKQFFDISIENMQELVGNINPVLDDLNIKINRFKELSALKKVLSSNTFLKEITIPIEGLLLFSILLIDELSKTTATIRQTLQLTKNEFDASFISNELLTELTEIQNDMELINKTIKLITNHLAPTDVTELLYLRMQVEKIGKQEQLLSPKNPKSKSTSRWIDWMMHGNSYK